MGYCAKKHHFATSILSLKCWQNRKYSVNLHTYIYKYIGPKERNKRKDNIQQQ